MNAPTGRNASVSGDGERDLGVGLVKLLADGGEAEDDQEEVEGVERPAEESGQKRRAMILRRGRGGGLAQEEL